MRFLSKFRLRRDRLRSPLALFAAAALAMLAAGGAVSFAETAGAVSPPASGLSPISDVNGVPNAISVAAPFIYAIPAGASGAPAANWAFQVNDNASAPNNNVWQAGDIFEICVSGGNQDFSSGQYVDFAAKPTLTVTGGSSGATAPAVAAALTENTTDVAADFLLTDCLDIAFLNSGDGTGLTPFTITISNITYNTGANTPVGTIGTLGVYVFSLDTTPATTADTLITVPPNAAIVGATVSANSPPVSVLPNSVNAPISPITVTETSAGTVQGSGPPGDLSVGADSYICVSASAGSFTGSPTITVSSTPVGGSAQVAGTVSIITPAAGPNAGQSTLVAQVLTPSVAPTTFTFSNLTVDAPAATGPVTATVTIDNNAYCDSPTAVTLYVPGSLIFNPVTIYTVGSVGHAGQNGSIYGATSEQTAVAALEFRFPPNPGGGCLPANTQPLNVHVSTHHGQPADVGSTVILTVDSNDGFDALSASYLASYTNTGVLLTEADSNTVDPYTLQAIQQEGVSTVIIVGGPEAVSAADQTELENTPSYACGGTVQRTNGNGGAVDLNVQRVYGQTADGTAAAVATYVNSGYVGSTDFSGAFNMYNDTTGTDSGSSPNIDQRTAILSTDLDSQDAESASSMSYWDAFPILLTPKTSLGPDAATALLNLGISQVIEIGGPLAIADSVNSQLESMGISVLRLAGQDGSDSSTEVARFELNSGTTANGQPEGLNTGGEWSNYSNGRPGCTNITSDPHNPTSPDSYYWYNGGDSNPVAFAVCSETVALVRGDFFADGITSSVVTGAWPMPVLLTESPTSLGQYLTAFLNQAGSPEGIDPVFNPTAPYVPYTGTTISSIQPFGGPLAMAPSTISAALAAIAAGANPS